MVSNDYHRVSRTPSPRTVTTTRARLALLVTLMLILFGWLSAPASAHVEVESDNATAGDANVVLRFNAESESNSAGITSLQVRLPSIIKPAAVTLVSAPPKWVMTRTSNGYEVGGPAVTPGKDAQYSIRLARVPDTATLTFPTIQGYSDGRKDAWIEQPAPGTTQEPDKPAPVLRVEGASNSSTAAATSAGATTAANQNNADSPDGASDEGGAVLTVLVIAAVVGVVAVGVVIAIRRRRPS